MKCFFSKSLLHLELGSNFHITNKNSQSDSVQIWTVMAPKNRTRVKKQSPLLQASSVPFPLAAGGQSGLFGGFCPAVASLCFNPDSCLEGESSVSCFCAVHGFGGSVEGRGGLWFWRWSQEAKYELCMEYRRSMGFPCKGPTSGVVMKQSLILVREVSLSMSWKMESVPVDGKLKTAAVIWGMKTMDCLI